ncbi:uncharacterized protein LOC143470608 isoform X2 [Clavelina lepadiformis]|uniref:uncharacterized protein LOC143470608 isoform X2 n=1 Tax=Clavelina lepadiformis TaxID=159417 RepID=UPI004041F188
MLWSTPRPNTQFLYSYHIIILLCWASVFGQKGSPCPEGFYLIRPKIFEAGTVSGTANCYKFVFEKVKFMEAKNACESLGAELATPKDESEATALTQYIVENSLRHRKYWIGLTDQEKEGYLRWIDDGRLLDEIAFPPPWFDREPSSDPSIPPGSIGDLQDCVKMAIWVYGYNQRARWYDTICDSREAYICEAPANHHVEAQDNTTTPIQPTTTNATGRADLDQDSSPPDGLGTLIEMEGGRPQPTQIAMKGVHNYPENDTIIDSSSSLPLQIVGYANGMEANNTNFINSSSKDKSKLKDSVHFKNLTSFKLKEKNNTILSDTAQERTCHLECTPNVMRAACPLKSFPFMKNSVIVLNNSTCRPRRNQTHLIIHATLDGCGTRAINLPGNQVSFRNVIQVFGKLRTVIENQERVTSVTDFMVLDCRYPQRNLIAHNFSPSEDNPSAQFTVMNGPTLPHAFMLYKTDEYECPYGKEDFPVEIETSGRLYFEVRLLIASEQVELHPVSCVATPDTDPYNSNNYVMMQDGCVSDATFQTEASNSPKISRFSVQAFRFLGFAERVYVHCELMVCTLASISSPSCPYACQSNRVKRDENDVDEEDNLNPAQMIFAKMGPIIITSQTDPEVEFRLRDEVFSHGHRTTIIPTEEARTSTTNEKNIRNLKVLIDHHVGHHRNTAKQVGKDVARSDEDGQRGGADLLHGSGFFLMMMAQVGCLTALCLLINFLA